MGDEYQDSFVCLIQAIKEKATLDTHGTAQRICLFRDDSEPN